MILTQTQKIVASDNHRFRVVNCGRRWGKTTLAILEMVAKGVFKSDSKICYIAPTYQQARDIAWEELKKITVPVALKANESRLEVSIKTKDGGSSLISLRGWESVETLRGQKFNFIVIDEIASMRNFWSNWQEVLRPTLTDYKGEVLFISTPKGFNHFYDLYNLENDPIKGKDYKSFHFTSYDNIHLPTEELDKAKLELTEDRFTQEYLADFRKTEGLVYKEFSRDSHLYDEKKLRMVKFVGGVDFGFNNPAAVLHIVLDNDKHYWVTEEWYKTGRVEEQIAEYVKSCNFNTVYPDPENASAIELFNRKGIFVTEVKKGKGSVESGINIVKGLFKQNRLHIHKGCSNLISELETYSYPEKKPNHNEPEAPIKENDHALDALRYVLSSMENEPIFIMPKASEPLKPFYPALGI